MLSISAEVWERVEVATLPRHGQHIGVSHRPQELQAIQPEDRLQGRGWDSWEGGGLSWTKGPPCRTPILPGKRMLILSCPSGWASGDFGTCLSRWYKHPFVGETKSNNSWVEKELNCNSSSFYLSPCDSPYTVQRLLEAGALPINTCHFPGLQRGSNEVTRMECMWVSKRKKPDTFEILLSSP